MVVARLLLSTANVQGVFQIGQETVKAPMDLKRGRSCHQWIRAVALGWHN
jgi:hypothetical protein